MEFFEILKKDFLCPLIQQWVLMNEGIELTVCFIFQVCEAWEAEKYSTCNGIFLRIGLPKTMLEIGKKKTFNNFSIIGRE